MTSIITTHHEVAIAGRVLEGITGNPIARSLVAITQGSAGPTDDLASTYQATRTRPDGLFYFLDLPEGDYELLAFLPMSGVYEQRLRAEGGDAVRAFEKWGNKRFGSTTFTAKVAYSGDRAFGSFQVVHLQPTSVTGRVLAADSLLAVLMAEVQCKGGSQRSFTDERGSYTLTGLQPNKVQEQVFVVRAQGYLDQSMRVLIDKAGTCNKAEDIALVTDR